MRVPEKIIPYKGLSLSTGLAHGLQDAWPGTTAMNATNRGCAVLTRFVETEKMRYIVLWALGVPITALIVLHLLGIL